MPLQTTAPAQCFMVVECSNGAQYQIDISQTTYLTLLQVNDQNKVVVPPKVKPNVISVEDYKATSEPKVIAKPEPKVEVAKPAPTVDPEIEQLKSTLRPATTRAGIDIDKLSKQELIQVYEYMLTQEAAIRSPKVEPVSNDMVDEDGIPSL